MTVPLSIKGGTTRNYPQNKDEDYGVEATAWAQDVTSALNATPNTKNVAQFDYILGTAVQVANGIATHSTLAAIQAVATGGESVYVLEGAYTYTAQLEFTKKLTIVNQSADCYHRATAALAGTSIFKISQDNFEWIGGVVQNSSGTPTAGIEINAYNVFVEVATTGVWSVAPLIFTLPAYTSSLIGLIRDETVDSIIYGTPNGGANQALSNLTSPTALNVSLTKPAGDFGLAATQAGADVTVTAAQDVTVTATAGEVMINAGGDVVLNPASNLPKVDISGVEQNLVYSVPIQDYTVVGNVGDASQWLAGTISHTQAELEHFFGVGKVYCAYNFNDAMAGGITHDLMAAYDYTLGAAGKAPSSGVGLTNVADSAISFDGGDYATNATKLDNMTTIFSGAGKGFVHSFWVIAPTDGQPVGANRIYYKLNSAANDRYSIELNTTGTISVQTKGNSATTKIVYTTSILPNGANNIWTHVVVCWDTTYGLKLYINGVNEATDSTATTLMVDGTTTDFFIGGSDATPSDPFTGRIAKEVIINKVAEQRDIDILFATTRPEPAVLAGKEYTVIDKVRPEADANYEYQGQAQVLSKYNGNIYLQGRQYGEADTVKIEAEVM